MTRAEALKKLLTLDPDLVDPALHGGEVDTIHRAMGIEPHIVFAHHRRSK